MAYITRKKLDGSALDRWEIIDKPMTFGRGDEADVQVKDERMSRVHFVVAPQGDKFIARDLDSTNGTFVNNNRITEVVLHANISPLEGTRPTTTGCELRDPSPRSTLRTSLRRTCCAGHFTRLASPHRSSRP